MKNFKIFISIILSIFLALIVWYWLVFAWPSQKDDINSLSSNLFLDSLELSTNKITLTTTEFPENFEISWDCLASWKYLTSYWYNHLFEVKLLDKNCSKENVTFYFKNKNKILSKTFSVFKEYNLYLKYLDYPDFEIEKILDIVKSDKNKFEKKSRVYQELDYLDIFLKNILEKRKQKYSTPIVWTKLPSRETKVPNSNRPYRAAYTDGIHQWWDFDAPKLTKAVAIDDAIVIRVVRWFTPSNFAKIKRTNLTEEIKATNLDILRWNQVWIKTMKWDIAFYSHFEEINPEIKVWDILKKGDILWKVWSTWVPEVWYSDFHMHIEIYKNPFDLSKAWKYDFLDIMNWPWYFKGKSARYVLEHQQEVFEEN